MTSQLYTIALAALVVLATVIMGEQRAQAEGVPIDGGSTGIPTLTGKPLLYVVNEGSNTVSIFNRDGTLADVGKGPGVFIQPGTSVNPRGIAFMDNGHVLLASFGTNQIVEYDSKGNFVKIFADRNSGLSYVQGLEIWDNTVYAASTGSNTVILFDLSGKRIGEFRHDKLVGPEDIERKGEDLYVSSGANGKIIKFDKSGEGQVFVDRERSLARPGDLLFMPNGDLLVASTDNNRVIEFGSDGQFKRVVVDKREGWGMGSFAIDIASNQIIVPSWKKSIIDVHDLTTGAFISHLVPKETQGMTPISPVNPLSRPITIALQGATKTLNKNLILIGNPVDQFLPIGGRGAVYVFDQEEKLLFKLTSPEKGFNKFGSSVLLTDDKIFVGDPENSIGCRKGGACPGPIGAVFVFDLSGKFLYKISNPEDGPGPFGASIGGK